MDYPNQPDAPNGRWVDSGENGQEGTAVRAASLNSLWDEIIGVIEASGQIPDASNLTQLRTAIGDLGGSAAGLKNWITNGGLRIWQRGESFDVTSDPIYTADRIEVQSDSTGGSGLGRITHEKGGVQPGVISGTWDFLRYEAVAATDGGGAAIRTKIDALEELSDRASTFSFIGRAETATTVSVEVRMNIGLTATVLKTVELTLGEQWGRHSVSFDMDNLLGQVITNISDLGANHLQLEIRLPAFADNKVDLARLQLEEGGAPSDFEQRDLSLEYMLCRRYYQTSLDLAEQPQSGNLSHLTAIVNGGDPRTFGAFRLVPPMRTIPSVTYFDSEGNPGRIGWGTSTLTVTGTSALLRSRSALPPPSVAGGAPSGETRALFNFTADAEL
jgi:hypothetical protein